MLFKMSLKRLALHQVVDSVFSNGVANYYFVYYTVEHISEHGILRI